MTALVVRADARALPLPDASADLIVTSPPYFALRSYQDGGEHYAGQIGGETSPAEYMAALLACTREWVRVLKPSGSMWVNLGDKYAQDSERSRNGNGNRVAIDGFTGGKPLRGKTVTLARKDNGTPRKSLIGLPWRYALRCVDELGLILRAEVIWSKPNGLPESVTDRVRRSHEQWFHFTKQPQYFSAVDEIRDSYAPETAGRYLSGYRTSSSSAAGQTRNGVLRHDGGGPAGTNPLGKLPGSVWNIPSQPLTVPAHLGVDHFAAFPIEWPRRIILGWSPSGICITCGQGRTTTTTTTTVKLVGSTGDTVTRTGQHDGRVGARKANRHEITGYACACPDTNAPTLPAVVLDPFGGTGTTALAAKALGRIGISVDMSADYCRIAAWRTTDPGELAKALHVEKPPSVISGQLDLFGSLP